MFGLTKTQTALLDIFVVVACLPFTSSTAYAPVQDLTESEPPVKTQQQGTVLLKASDLYIPELKQQ